MPKTWFITGVSRGLGAEIAKAAMRAGDRIVAAGRKRSAIAEKLGPDSDSLLSVQLDVTDVVQVRTAVREAVHRFGGIEVLVNNAGYGHMGFFEEMTLKDVKEQFDTNLFGVFQVIWATLPLMRSARKGKIFNVSSIAGLVGAQMASLYCTSKFALEGFSESLAKEVSPFGISVTIVEPGPFRTEFLKSESLRFGGKPIADYEDSRRQIRASMEERNGRQPGDPQKLAEAMVGLANEAKPPLRFFAGALAVNVADQKLAIMRAEIDSWRQLSISTDGNYDDAKVEGALRQLT
jgi:NAD(P)-dependent dehydrogenase (short-subunit alcohol dehydrogenase family)